MSVCKSIPTHWIVKLKESLKDCGTPEDHRVFEETPDLYFQKEKYKIEKCTQKIVLNIIRNKRIKPVNKYKSKMSDKYKINDKQWKQKYTFISQWSISTKNRSFMWRFLYGIVYTNEDFFKFGFKENKKCSFCQEEGQSKEHLFLTCQKVVTFRQEVVNKYDKIFTQSAVGDKEFMFGFEKSLNVDDERANLILALMNKYIYYNNFHAKELSIYGLQAEIVDMERIEYSIAMRKGKLGPHLFKWENIKTVLE